MSYSTTPRSSWNLPASKVEPRISSPNAIKRVAVSESPFNCDRIALARETPSMLSANAELYSAKSTSSADVPVSPSAPGTASVTCGPKTTVPSPVGISKVAKKT